MTNETVLRKQIIETARTMYERDFISGIAGNISVRLTPETLLLTPGGGSKADLRPEELLVIDLEGNCLAGDGTCTPSSELPMHLEVYRQRPDVGAVVHAHPVICVALSLVGVSLAPPYIPEALVFLGPIATAPYATPSSTENRDAIAGLIHNHDTIILAHHGSLTVGRNLKEAYHRLEVLEHTARTIAAAFQIGTPRQLAESAVEKLLGQRERLGFSHPEESDLSLRIAAEVERLTTGFRGR